MTDDTKDDYLNALGWLVGGYGRRGYGKTDAHQAIKRHVAALEQRLLALNERYEASSKLFQIESANHLDELKRVADYVAREAWNAAREEDPPPTIQEITNGCPPRFKYRSLDAWRKQQEAESSG